MKTFIIFVLAVIAMTQALSTGGYKKRSYEEDLAGDVDVMGHVVARRSVQPVVYRRSINLPDPSVDQIRERRAPVARSVEAKTTVAPKVNGEPVKVEGKSFGMGGMGYPYGYGGGYGGYPYYSGYYG